MLVISLLFSLPLVNPVFCACLPPPELSRNAGIRLALVGAMTGTFWAVITEISVIAVAGTSGPLGRHQKP